MGQANELRQGRSKYFVLAGETTQPNKAPGEDLTRVSAESSVVNGIAINFVLFRQMLTLANEFSKRTDCCRVSPDQSIGM